MWRNKLKFLWAKLWAKHPRQIELINVHMLGYNKIWTFVLKTPSQMRELRVKDLSSDP